MGDVVGAGSLVVKNKSQRTDLIFFLNYKAELTILTHNTVIMGMVLPQVVKSHTVPIPIPMRPI